MMAWKIVQCPNVFTIHQIGLCHQVYMRKYKLKISYGYGVGVFFSPNKDLVFFHHKGVFKYIFFDYKVPWSFY